MFKNYRFHRSASIWFGLALVVLIFDQVTKYLVSQSFQLEETLRFTSFFNFTLRHNYGMAFSFLHDAGGWQRWFLSALSFIVSVALVFWIGGLGKTKKLESLGLALVLGGAVGNLVDRVILGYVVDFIVFHYEHRMFPAFNIADAAISLGAGMLIFDSLFLQNQKTEEATA